VFSAINPLIEAGYPTEAQCAKCKQVGGGGELKSCYGPFHLKAPAVDTCIHIPGGLAVPDNAGCECCDQ